MREGQLHDSGMPSLLQESSRSWPLLHKFGYLNFFSCFNVSTKDFIIAFSLGKRTVVCEFCHVLVVVGKSMRPCIWICSFMKKVNGKADKENIRW